MTAEVAILNSEGVALAADSAVTVSWGSDQKVFGSQNKIFALTDGAPVGVLVYGASTFMSIPFETLIKEYRRKHGTITYPKIEDYAARFCDFLVALTNRYLSEDHQNQSLVERVGTIYEDIEKSIDQSVESYKTEMVDERKPLMPDALEAETASLMKDTVDSYYQVARRAELVEGATKELMEEARGIVRPHLARLRREIFDRDIPRATVRKLNDIAARSVGTMIDEVTRWDSGGVSGVAICGFGEDDLLPGYKELQLDGCYRDLLRYREGGSGEIRAEHQAMVIPFAQGDMIELFMRGMHPEYGEYVHSLVEPLLRRYVSVLLNRVDGMPEEERRRLEMDAEEDSETIAEVLMEDMSKFGQSRFTDEIVQVIEGLPKEELAELAETLVNLTSRSRRVSLGEESVGGPTDVALITKGDGFVWIKRKHYFPRELNLAYEARILRGAKNDARHGNDGME